MTFQFSAISMCVTQILLGPVCVDVIPYENFVILKLKRKRPDEFVFCVTNFQLTNESE
jgi:hypothetical protein